MCEAFFLEFDSKYFPSDKKEQDLIFDEIASGPPYYLKDDEKKIVKEKLINYGFLQEN